MLAMFDRPIGDGAYECLSIWPNGHVEIEQQVPKHQSVLIYEGYVTLHPETGEVILQEYPRPHFADATDMSHLEAYMNILVAQQGYQRIYPCT